MHRNRDFGWEWLLTVGSKPAHSWQVMISKQQQKARWTGVAILKGNSLKIIFLRKEVPVGYPMSRISPGSTSDIIWTCIYEFIYLYIIYICRCAHTYTHMCVHTQLHTHVHTGIEQQWSTWRKNKRKYLGGVEGGKGRGKGQNCILILKNQNQNRVFNAVRLLLLVERAGCWKLQLSCLPWWLTVAGWSLVAWQPLLAALGLLCRRPPLTRAAGAQCHLSGGQYWGGQSLGSEPGAELTTHWLLDFRAQDLFQAQKVVANCEFWKGRHYNEVKASSTGFLNL